MDAFVNGTGSLIPQSLTPSAIKNALTPSALKNTPASTLATIVIGLTVLLLFLVWAIYRIVDSGMRISSITSGVISLAQPTVVDAARVPRLDSGVEYGFSIWLYINELPNRIEDSPILSVNSVPVMSFDKNRSNVLVRFPQARPPPGEVESTVAHASFDHVSQRRWVHLMAVHSDGALTLFEDGELHSVNRVPHVDIVPPSGGVRLGGKPCDAYVSGVVFLNHSPSSRQVKGMYRAGPQTANWLFDAMGFSNIGVRSPIYNLANP